MAFIENTRLRSVIALSVAVLAGFSTVLAKDLPKVGDIPPAIEAVDQDGKIVHVTDNRDAQVHLDELKEAVVRLAP